MKRSHAPTMLNQQQPQHKRGREAPTAAAFDLREDMPAESAAAAETLDAEADPSYYSAPSVTRSVLAPYKCPLPGYSGQRRPRKTLGVKRKLQDMYNYRAPSQQPEDEPAAAEDDDEEGPLDARGRRARADAEASEATSFDDGWGAGGSGWGGGGGGGGTAAKASAFRFELEHQSDDDGRTAPSPYGATATSARRPVGAGPATTAAAPPSTTPGPRVVANVPVLRRASRPTRFANAQPGMNLSSTTPTAAAAAAGINRAAGDIATELASPEDAWGSVPASALPTGNAEARFTFTTAAATATGTGTGIGIGTGTRAAMTIAAVTPFPQGTRTIRHTFSVTPPPPFMAAKSEPAAVSAAAVAITPAAFVTPDAIAVTATADAPGFPTPHMFTPAGVRLRAVTQEIDGMTAGAITALEARGGGGGGGGPVNAVTPIAFTAETLDGLAPPVCTRGDPRATAAPAQPDAASPCKARQPSNAPPEPVPVAATNAGGVGVGSGVGVGGSGGGGSGGSASGGGGSSPADLDPGSQASVASWRPPDAASPAALDDTAVAPIGTASRAPEPPATTATTTITFTTRTAQPTSDSRPVSPRVITTTEATGGPAREPSAADVRSPTRNSRTTTTTTLTMATPSPQPPAACAAPVIASTSTEATNSLVAPSSSSLPEPFTGRPADVPQADAVPAAGQRDSSRHSEAPAPGGAASQASERAPGVVDGAPPAKAVLNRGNGYDPDQKGDPGQKDEEQGRSLEVQHERHVAASGGGVEDGTRDPDGNGSREGSGGGNGTRAGEGSGGGGGEAGGQQLETHSQHGEGRQESGTECCRSMPEERPEVPGAHDNGCQNATQEAPAGAGKQFNGGHVVVESDAAIVECATKACSAAAATGIEAEAPVGQGGGHGVLFIRGPAGSWDEHSDANLNAGGQVVAETVVAEGATATESREAGSDVTQAVVSAGTAGTGVVAETGSAPDTEQAPGLVSASASGAGAGLTELLAAETGGAEAAETTAVTATATEPATTATATAVATAAEEAAEQPPGSAESAEPPPAPLSALPLPDNELNDSGMAAAVAPVFATAEERAEEGVEEASRLTSLTLPQLSETPAPQPLALVGGEEAVPLQVTVGVDVTGTSEAIIGGIGSTSAAVTEAQTDVLVASEAGMEVVPVQQIDAEIVLETAAAADDDVGVMADASTVGRVGLGATPVLGTEGAVVGGGELSLAGDPGSVDALIMAALLGDMMAGDDG